MDRKDENWILITIGVVAVTVLGTLWASGYFSEEPALINEVKIGIQSYGNYTVTYTNGRNAQQTVSGNGTLVINLERPNENYDGIHIWTVSVNARMLDDYSIQLHVTIWAEKGNEDFVLADDWNHASNPEVQVAAAVTYWVDS